MGTTGTTGTELDAGAIGRRRATGRQIAARAWRVVVVERVPVLLALAVAAAVFDGLAHRYQLVTVNENSYTFAKLDRLTGSVLVCTFGKSDRPPYIYTCAKPAVIE